MSIRAIRFSAPVAITGVRFHANGLGGAKPPAFYQSYIHGVGVTSDAAAKFSERMVTDAPSASLTPEQMETVRDVNRKAQELLKATYALQAAIPIDASVRFQDSFSSLMQGPNLQSNMGFAQGYAMGKMDQTVHESIASTPDANTAEAVGETLASAGPALEAVGGILDVFSSIFGGSE